MGQCRTSDANVTIGCYYDDYSSCDHTILFGTFFPPHLFASFFKIKVTACI